jgi:translocator assembly and maintenance protein 41
VFLQQDSDSDSGDSPGKKVAQEKKMLDVILVVKDAAKFHEANLRVNSHHYVSLFRDPVRATWWQKHDTIDTVWIRNPKIFFNFVEEPWMKYGVIEISDLGSDLIHWDSLYIGGRMHKPTATIASTPEGDEKVSAWQNLHNLPAAFSTALLLSTAKKQSEYDVPEKTLSLTELYGAISSLSYTGDFRMQVGAEDPSKIRKLVDSPGQLDRFHQLYNKAALQPLIKQGVISYDTTQQSISWNPKDPSSIQHLWQQLPPKLQCLRTNNADLQQALHSIVAPAARYQSFKGLWTAGLAKSTRYAAAKLAKGVFRRK